VPPYPETTQYIQRVARTYAKVKAEQARHANQQAELTGIPSGK
jgi:hypothetical protein